MTPLPQSPFITEPFVLNEPQFLFDVYGEHELPESDPVEIDFEAIADILTKF